MKKNTSYSFKIETVKELFELCKKYSSRIHEKFLVYTKEFRKDSDIFCIPFYFVLFL